MQNTLVINASDSCDCELLSNVDNGTNSVILEIISDVSKNPKLSINDNTVMVTENPFPYTIPTDYYTGSGNLTFNISDDDHTGDAFTISKVQSTDGNLMLKQVSNFEYTLSVLEKSGVLPISEGGTGASTTGEASNNLMVHSLCPSVYIPENDDLDNYKTPGCYSCASGTVANTISNSPFSSSYILFVYRTDGTDGEYSNRMQYALRYDGTWKHRRTSGSGWTSWTQLKFTDTTYSDMTGATDSDAGRAGLVPAPAAGDNAKFLSGDGTWKNVDLSSCENVIEKIQLNGNDLTVTEKTVNVEMEGVTAPKISASDIAAVDVSSGAWKQLGSMSIDAGLWLILITARFAANASGRRILRVTTSSSASGSAISRQAETYRASAGDNYTTCELAFIRNLTATAKYYVTAYQNSGNTLSVDTTYTLVKLA